MSYLGLSGIGDAFAAHPLNALRRTGIVSAAGTDGFVDVYLGGDTTQLVHAPHLGAYSPTVGDTVAILTAGSDHIVLGSVAGVGKRRYRFHGTYSRAVANNTTQALTSITSTIVREESDLAVSPRAVGVFTIPFDTWVFAHFQCDNITTTATSRAFMSIRWNSAIAIGRSDRENISVTADMTTTGYAYMKAGDTVDFLLFQNSGASVTQTGFVVLKFD